MNTKFLVNDNYNWCKWIRVLFIHLCTLMLIDLNKWTEISKGHSKFVSSYECFDRNQLKMWSKRDSFWKDRYQEPFRISKICNIHIREVWDKGEKSLLKMGEKSDVTTFTVNQAKLRPFKFVRYYEYLSRN